MPPDVFSFLRKVLSPPGAPPPSLADELAAAATAFAAVHNIQSVYNLDALPVDLLREQLPSAAAYFGEHVRSIHGGAWIEHPRYGIVLGGVGGISGAKLLALDIIERKIARGADYSLARFVDTLDARLKAEAHETKLAPGISRVDPARVADNSPAAAKILAEEFRQYWKARLGADLPLSLIGVRQLDGFVRAQRYLNCLHDDVVIAAGFFVGETARGLFGGHWAMQPGEPIERIGLVFPELTYYPVGRLFKMLTEPGDVGPLDEYVRLIPAARKELLGEQ